jgi:hypothetical protein
MKGATGMTDHVGKEPSPVVPTAHTRERERMGRGLARKNALGLLTLATLLLAVWMIAESPLFHKTAPPGLRLRDLRAVSQLRTRFDADRGMTRLILRNR